MSLLLKLLLCVGILFIVAIFVILLAGLLFYFDIFYDDEQRKE